MLKRTSQTNVVENLILNQYQWKHSIVVDLTTINRYNPFAKLSPYYPHGDIPILNSPYLLSNSVNEVWQILCVNKETSGEYKDVLFRKGIGINEYYTYEEARSERSNMFGSVKSTRGSIMDDIQQEDALNAQKNIANARAPAGAKKQEFKVSAGLLD